jgi:hypothetical protein
MRKSLLFLLFVTLSSVGKAQDITIYKTFGGLRFERDSLILSPKQVQYILEVNPAALAEFKKARKNSGIASVLGFTGGLLVVIPVGSALVGGKPEWGFAAAGAALIVASIPFNAAFKRQAQNAVDIYNQQKTSSLLERAELFWAGTGLGIRIRF